MSTRKILKSGTNERRTDGRTGGIVRGAALALALAAVAFAPRASEAVEIQQTQDIAATDAMVCESWGMTVGFPSYTCIPGVIEPAGLHRTNASDVIDLFSEGDVVEASVVDSVMTWVSNITSLPMQELPKVRRFRFESFAVVPFREMASDGREAGMVMDEEYGGTQTAAHYDEADKTIYLPHGWTNSIVADMSMLVHAMVSHLQNAGGVTYPCSQHRDEVAYDAQERYLRLFDHGLFGEFEIDRYALMMSAACTH